MKLLKKELRLVTHSTNILFLFLTAMVLIPNYPYYVIFFYTTLGIFFAVLNGREDQDISYSLLLPVRKRDVVKARFLFVVFFECVQCLAVLPFIALKNQLHMEENLVGMEANLALVGIGFLLFGVYNLMFFSAYYKDPQKVGKAFLAGMIPMGICMVVAEILVHVQPFFRDRLDTMGSVAVYEKIIVLLIGIAGYGLMTFGACRRAQKSFERIDL